MKKVALVIGHRPSSAGARNVNADVGEYNFNNRLAKTIEYQLRDTDIQCEIVYRNSYAELPKEVNALEPDFIVSLHCNAFDTKASGTEVLYYHSSKLSKAMAEVLQEHLLFALGLNNRGVKAKHSEDRGGYFLRYTDAPCVIAEPFFIDNDEDFSVASSRSYRLAEAYKNAITDIAQVLS